MSKDRKWIIISEKHRSTANQHTVLRNFQTTKTSVMLMLLAGNGFGTIWIICCHFPKTPLNSGTAYNKKLHQEHVSKITFYDQGIGKQRDIRDGLIRFILYRFRSDKLQNLRP
eukprot:TRINITY_DN10580_c0_g1_i4.p1 TRINITY_DN10580_c0_g1~~TRINITY_DN10580_c0_g1_i4.p1  ORF type:complete len:113 (-),score=3.32 TRINITY_DN10580_c0_g1_i4:1256-1594(-)